jgi:hypothetical protein
MFDGQTLIRICKTRKGINYIINISSLGNSMKLQKLLLLAMLNSAKVQEKNFEVYCMYSRRALRCTVGTAEEH